MLSLATYIPDTKPIVKMRNRLTSRYFLQSPASSLGMRLISGFLVFFFFMPVTLLTIPDLPLKLYPC